MSQEAAAQTGSINRLPVLITALLVGVVLPLCSVGQSARGPYIPGCTNDAWRFWWCCRRRECSVYSQCRL